MNKNDYKEIDKEFKKYKNNALKVIGFAEDDCDKIAWFAINGTDDNDELNKIADKTLRTLLQSYLKKEVVRCRINDTFLDTKLKLDIVSKKTDYDAKVDSILDNALDNDYFDTSIQVVEEIVPYYPNEVKRAEEIFDKDISNNIKRNWTCCERKIIGHIFFEFSFDQPNYQYDYLKYTKRNRKIDMFVSAPPCVLCLPSLYRIHSTIYFRKPGFYELSVEKMGGNNFRFKNKRL